MWFFRHKAKSILLDKLDAPHFTPSVLVETLKIPSALPLFTDKNNTTIDL